MAGNVFGDPVTDDVVRNIYPNENITPELRAKVAIQYINAGDRYVKCKDFVHSLKEKYGEGVFVLCMIFNATGHTSTFAGFHDWHGHIYKPPYPPVIQNDPYPPVIQNDPYPKVIQNGQWGVFLHVGSDSPFPIIQNESESFYPTKKNESESAVIYRGKNRAGGACDWMLAWDVPCTGFNHVYTEIHESDHYKKINWDHIKVLLESQSTKHAFTWNKCYSAVKIGQGTSPEFEGIMALEGFCGLSTTL